MAPASTFAFSLCADDYAMTPAVSRGILEALEAGALTATSVMTTMACWPAAASALRAMAERADVGLHLNLTLAAPLGAMPVLAPDGRLPPITRFMRGGALPAAEIEAEVDRQLDAFEQAWGAPPDHVDGHQHVHIFPVVRDALLRQLDRRGLRGKVWIRDSADSALRIIRRGATVKKALGLSVLARGMGSAVRSDGYPTNDGFAGFSDFRLDRDYGALFARYLRHPGLRHLVMCHPGHVDEALRALDPVTDSREQELAFLCSPRFFELLARHGARLERMSRLLGDGAASERRTGRRS